MRYIVPVLAVLVSVADTQADPADPGPESNLRDERFFTEAEARDRIYGPGQDWTDTFLVMDSTLRQELNDRTGLREERDTVWLHYGTDRDGQWLGAYRVASEVGKHRAFEFLVGLDARLRVRDIIVLTYREARGGEVRRERFTRQYRGKDITSPIRLNRDILSISGATMSSMAVNRGVKKTLWWANVVWPGRGTAP